MTDDDALLDEDRPEDEVEVEASEAEEALAEMDAAFDEEAGMDVDTEALLAAAAMDRVSRQAYWHGNQKQLFTFLFANCLFFAGALVAWTRSTPGDPAGDPSTYITGLHTIRGAFIFALAIYGFWTAVFNIWHAQMKVWPYLLNAVLALWVGVSGFAQGIGGEEWDKAGEYLKSLESKKVLDDILVRFSVIAPGYWLLTFGGLIVAWVIVNGLMKGAQQSEAAKAREAGDRSSRRRR